MHIALRLIANLCSVPMKTNICGANWCCAGVLGSNSNCCKDKSSQFDRPIIQPLVADAPVPVTITRCSASGTSSPSKSSKSHCVDSSTAVGLGAGLGVALLIALCVIAWLILSARKRASRDEALRSSNPAMQSSSQAYSHSGEYNWTGTTQAKHNGQIAEVPGNSRRFEIPS